MEIKIVSEDKYNGLRGTLVKNNGSTVIVDLDGLERTFPANEVARANPVFLSPEDKHIDSALLVNRLEDWLEEEQDVRVRLKIINLLNL